MTDDDFELINNEPQESKSTTNAWKFDRLADGIFADLAAKGQYPLYHKGAFYTWDGCRYVEENELEGIIRKWLRSNNKPQANITVGNVDPIVRSLAQRLTSQYGNLPFYVGAEPFPTPSNVIAYSNGLLDVGAYLHEDVSLIPHTPKWISTTCLPYKFEPDAKCPQWETFLDEVYEGRADKIAVLQEWFGYCLTADMSQHRVMFLTGMIRSGKGTIQRILESLVGMENAAAGYDLNYLTKDYGLASLNSKLVATVGELELNKNFKRQNIQMLNAIVGCDAVEIHRKFKDAQSGVKLNVRFTIACNDLPTYVDASGALTTRMLVLDHQTSFANRMDIHLEGRLRTELSGINNWALKGLAQVRLNGRFSESAEMIDKRQEYRSDNADTLAFVQESLTVEASLNPGTLYGVRLTDKPVSVHADKLQAAYALWCLEQHRGEQGDKGGWLGRNLKSIIPKMKYDKKRRLYCGIGLAALDGEASPPSDPPHKPSLAVVEMTAEQFQKDLAAM